MASYGAPSFNEFAAGAKVYGGGRMNPTMGPVDKTGYAERDRKRKVRRNALLARLKAKQKGAYASSNALKGGM
jgi:hypothetical protein